MKFKFSKKYISIGIVAFAVIVLSVICVRIAFQADTKATFFSTLFKAIQPVFFGMLIAYLFNPILNFFEKKFFYPIILNNSGTIGKTKKKVYRVVSVILTYLLIGFFIFIFIRLVAPELVKSINELIQSFPSYVSYFRRLVNSFISKNPMVFQEIDDYFNVSTNDMFQFVYDTVLPKVQEFISNLSSGVFSALVSFWNFLIGFIISFYVLLNKETFSGQAKKIIYSIFAKERANSVLKDVRFVSDTFIGFISGKIIDSMIIGVLCFIGCTILHMPYSLLISIIVGVTNIIPFFGPFIGAIPSALLVLMDSDSAPIMCLYFVIFIIVLQQLDGNLIGPKILGDSTGLSGFWVIFSITVFGSLWSVVGMFIGIPFFAVVYAMVKRNVERRLDNKELPVKTEDYVMIKRIEDGGDIVNLIEADDNFYLESTNKSNLSVVINKLVNFVKKKKAERKEKK